MPERHDRHAEHGAQSERHSRQPPGARRRQARWRRTPDPPTAPSTVFFGLIAGASGRASERAARIVLRGVADDHRQHQQEQRVAAARLANGNHRAERQAEIQRRKQARRGEAERVAAAVPVRSASAAPSATSADISTTSIGARAGRRQTPRTSASPRQPAGIAGTGNPLARASATYSTNAEHEQQLGDGEEDGGGAEPDDRDREGEQDGAAQNASHLAPSATGPTGDGLMPPYRRSRF